jgi:hypothetical protein
MASSRVDFTFICSRAMSLGNRENSHNVTLLFIIYLLRTVGYTIKADKCNRKQNWQQQYSQSVRMGDVLNIRRYLAKHDPKIRRKIWESAGEY